MPTKPEDAVAQMQKKNLESAMRLAQLSIENSQRILQLQVDVAREIFDDGVNSAKALAQAKSPQDAMELRARYAQHAADKMFSCSRSIAEITSDMQAELGHLVSDQLNKGGQEMFDAMQQMLKGMPLNSHAAAEALQHTFDTARKTLEQVAKASSDAFSSFAQMPGGKK
ncbi:MULTISPECIES: phasin family protein [Uliginosibacterium]|uniref:Phasin family protein n=1 Tax=Uliginosibacterium aquaticum TaxID=2731212 RepID=A0ABX2ILG3_9RHOO|nr:MULTISPECIES: phasin family protein [Uliginosibacterium]NSL56728.1 phasin family protein [Uliginosibacterium aquaticum]PLK47752.1 phasin protein [Uliginosibacterium sp. TH139]